MTENPWPQAAPSTSTDEYLNPGAVPAGGGDSSPSRREAVKNEAAAVAGHAAGEAKHVAETAKAEAANVASEVKTGARDLLHQAKTDLTEQAGTQQQKAAEGIRSISSQLHTMADASDQPGVASDLIRQAAERSQSVASWLENRDPGSLLEEVKSFARQRPGTFLLAAAGAGILAGRLGRSLQAGAPDTPPAGPTPAHLASAAPAPARQETVPADGSADPFFDGPVPPSTAGPVPTQALPSGTAADTPLRDNVPFPRPKDGQL